MSAPHNLVDGAVLSLGSATVLRPFFERLDAGRPVTLLALGALGGAALTMLLWVLVPKCTWAKLDAWMKERANAPPAGPGGGTTTTSATLIQKV